MITRHNRQLCNVPPEWVFWVVRNYFGHSNCHDICDESNRGQDNISLAGTEPQFTDSVVLSPIDCALSKHRQHASSDVSSGSSRVKNSDAM